MGVCRVYGGGGGSRRKRGDILARASLNLRTDARRMQAERGVKNLAPEIKLARDQQRAPQLFHCFVRREMRPLVEPFWPQQLAAGTGGRALPFNLDLAPHERLPLRVH